MLIKEMTATECRHVLAGTNFGRLGCARDGQPYVVPIYFAFDGEHLYGSSVFCFSEIGQKIEWMRLNPLVCLEVDDVKSACDWKSVVVFGRYQELTKTPEHEVTLRHAYDLLRKRAVWWEPASVGVADSNEDPVLGPIYFRIRIDQLSGRQGIPEKQDISVPKAGSWLGGILQHVRGQG